MLNFFKNWFAKAGDAAVMQAPVLCEPDVPSPVATVPHAVVAPQAPPPRRGPAKDFVRLSLSSILAQLPVELRKRISQSTEIIAMSAEISLPLETVIPQLSSGAVKISFGELRKLAPTGTFTRDESKDAEQVSLPLAEIFPQIDPSLLQRRPVQRFEVPEEISGPFSDLGRNVKIAGDTKPQPAPVPKREEPAPVPSRVPSAPEVIPFTIAKEAPVFRGFAPQAIGMPTQPIAMHNPPPQSTGPTNVPAPKPAAGSMIFALAELAEAWPDAVRAEIVQLNMAGSKVVLPEKLIEQGLRLGKVAFTWRELRSWVQPARFSSISPNDGVVLPLPLKIIAPLFLSKQNGAPAGKKTVTEQVEAIPSLFFASKPPPVVETLVESQLEDTNYYVWKDVGDSPDENDVTQRAGKSLPTKIADTAFLRRYATPNEIVSKAAALDGVAGALIALPDGLLVASRIPNTLNADTLAAFLPQIFGRVSQSTKELRMGDLNNLNFTVGNTPWKIFRVGSIFFAAFGKAGEPLPTAQLAGLAAELDRKPKH